MIITLVRVYPISLVNLENYLAVIIGGGKVAARKLAELWNTEFQIKVISPDFCEEIISLVNTNRENPFHIIKRPYQFGDLSNAFLAIACTNDPIVNQEIWKEAQLEKCLINIVDAPQKSNFYSPSVIHRGSLTITLASGGSNPALLKWLSNKFEALLDEELLDLFEITARIRSILLQSSSDDSISRSKNWDNFVNSLISTLENQGVSAAKKDALEFLQTLEL